MAPGPILLPQRQGFGIDGIQRGQAEQYAPIPSPLGNSEEGEVRISPLETPGPGPIQKQINPDNRRTDDPDNSLSVPQNFTPGTIESTGQKLRPTSGKVTQQSHQEHQKQLQQEIPNDQAKESELKPQGQPNPFRFQEGPWPPPNQMIPPSGKVQSLEERGFPKREPSVNKGDQDIGKAKKQKHEVASSLTPPGAESGIPLEKKPLRGAQKEASLPSLLPQEERNSLANRTQERKGIAVLHPRDKPLPSSPSKAKGQDNKTAPQLNIGKITVEITQPKPAVPVPSPVQAVPPSSLARQHQTRELNNNLKFGLGQI